MRFLLFISILTIVFFVASPLAALWVGVATLVARVLFALAGLLLRGQPGCARSFLVRAPVLLAGMLGVVLIDAQVGHVAVFSFLAIVILGIASSGKTRRPKLTVSAGNNPASAVSVEGSVERQAL